MRGRPTEKDSVMECVGWGRYFMLSSLPGDGSENKKKERESHQLFHSFPPLWQTIVQFPHKAFRSPVLYMCFSFLYLPFAGPFSEPWQACGSRGSPVKLWRLPACWERRLNSPAWLQGSTFGPHISHIQDEGATASVGWGCVGWNRFTRVSVGSTVEKGLSGVAGNAFRSTYKGGKTFFLNKNDKLLPIFFVNFLLFCVCQHFDSESSL